MNRDKQNQEGYDDPTAYEALTNIEQEERLLRAFRPIVYICSPYLGDVERNARAARNYSRYAVDKGYIPLAPHLLFPQFLQEDNPNSRVAVECMIKDYDITIAGEITSNHTPDFKDLTNVVLAGIGLPDVEAYTVNRMISKQSADIALGVDLQGAGDQGMMFGYATNETHEMLPIPFVLATAALERLKDSRNPILLPDAKSQVTYDYKRKRIDTFLVSTQHAKHATLEDVREAIQAVMQETAKTYGMNTDFRALVNPTGRFVIGSSFADTGVTGRKIIADTYGGACRHGGGAFSGKDPTKVDRSGAYMARKIAKSIVRAGYAKRCEVQLAYAIGMPEPVSVSVDCFGTGRLPQHHIVQWIRKRYDLTPAGIISLLHLREVDYNQISSYGHFWRSWMPWEL